MRARLAFFLAIAVSLFAPNPSAIAEVKQTTIDWSGFYIGANGGTSKRIRNTSIPPRQYRSSRVALRRPDWLQFSDQAARSRRRGGRIVG